jgi:hypothetical protein
MALDALNDRFELCVPRPDARAAMMTESDL